jgi:plastocyanin
MARSGGRLAFGSGREVVLADAAPSPVVRSRVLLEANATGGALLRDRLFLVLDGSRLAALDLGDPAGAVQPVDLVPLLSDSRIRVTAMGNLLLVAEDHHGVHLVKFRRMHPMPGHAGHGGQESVVLGRFPLAGRITALAAGGGTLWIATESVGELLQVDLRVPSRPVLERRVYLDTPIVALASDGTRLHVLTDDGLQVLAGGEDGMWEVMERHPGLQGASLVSGGRLLLVGSRDGGVQAYRDAAPGAAQFTVNVLDDFFTPETLTVNVGDTVRWRNAAGIHNVYSCVVGEAGCTADANEVFTSGIPFPGIWSYSYTFTTPGDNPYVCQSHAPFMTGEVTVLSGAACGDLLDDGGDCWGAPAPLGQGYWHRQCLGVPASGGGIDPGRRGRGPSEPREPEFFKTLMPEVSHCLLALGFEVDGACAGGMDAEPQRDPCQRALKHYTALLFNLASGRLHEGCGVDVAASGCLSTDVESLMTELATLILSGDTRDCKRAAACAAAVNEGEAVGP